MGRDIQPTGVAIRRRLVDGFALGSGWLAAVGAMTSPAGYPLIAGTAFVAGIGGLVLAAIARLAMRDRARYPARVASSAQEPDRKGDTRILLLLALATIALTVGMTIRAEMLVPLFEGGMESTAIVADHPWVAMAMADLYGGFILVAGWLSYRERDALRAGILIYLLWFWGNMVVALYILWLIAAHRHTPRQILLGWRA
ncbi:hypothetical protein [Sphingopyxis terrae]|uniref:hypothetical protein n=1 Tax=Sphingopyxis terrae TaxID=33052 RepID=UPI002A180376|nr:hypothetical protein [Sphingopyxis terrae]MDX8356400.1 hypothetical protein [Sphingopyxis terrae]